MLIDSNAYVGHWPYRVRKYNTLEMLLSRMDQFGVDKAIVSSLNGIFYKNTQPANEELIEQLNSSAQFADRFIPFGVVNPIYGGWKDDFDSCANDLAMRGLKLYPKYHAYDLLNPNCIELVKMAREKKMVIALSLRMVDSRPSSWMDITNEWQLKDIIPIMKAVPDAKYLIQNVSGSTNLDAQEAKILKSSNVAIDTSGRYILNLGELIKTYGSEKFCFGTHSPMLDYCTGRLRVESLRPNEASEHVKQSIRSTNIERLLEL